MVTLASSNCRCLVISSTAVYCYNSTRKIKPFPQSSKPLNVNRGSTCGEPVPSETNTGGPACSGPLSSVRLLTGAALFMMTTSLIPSYSNARWVAAGPAGRFHFMLPRATNPSVVNLQPR